MVDRWIDDAVVLRTIAAEMGQLSVQFVAIFVFHCLIHPRAVTGAPTLGRPIRLALAGHRCNREGDTSKVPFPEKGLIAIQNSFRKIFLAIVPGSCCRLICRATS